MKFFKISLFSLFLFFLYITPAFAYHPETPLVSGINPSIKTFLNPLVFGETEANTRVLVYLDGEYFSDAEVLNFGDKAKFNFFVNELPREGLHKIFFISQASNGVLSPPSKELDFYITKKIDLPKIINISTGENPMIFGKSENENTVDIFIDGQLFSSIFIPYNSNNTFSVDLGNISKGAHNASFIARDAMGRKSLKTESLAFYISSEGSKGPENNQEEYTEAENSTASKQNENSNNTTYPEISSKAETEEVVVEGVDNINTTTSTSEDLLSSELEDINTSEDQETQEGGALNEDGEKQSDLKWNLIIFLSFLVAVILWIVWVNKEIKEEE
ncbi:hypothetical protein C0584_05785 [Candidatus Parcubacteria bacterium]|nr:MAG: hypothetical protein C0584_05785 [Candidatus Parcubacteria bacterium]